MVGEATRLGITDACFFEVGFAFFAETRLNDVVAAEAVFQEADVTATVVVTQVAVVAFFATFTKRVAAGRDAGEGRCLRGGGSARTFRGRGKAEDTGEVLRVDACLSGNLECTEERSAVLAFVAKTRGGDGRVLRRPGAFTTGGSGRAL